MDSEYTIFAVDDVEASRRIVESTLGKIYNVESFSSGQACLDRLSERVPDLFLLDVDMPEMDGYTLCREIRCRPDSGAVPAIFISALDDLESRLAGYDAGGDDFIVKPYKFAELKQKVEVLRRIDAEKMALRRQLDESDTLTTQILSSLDEYAVLVKFLRSLNGCDGNEEIAEAVLSMLRAYHLDGALQFRLPGSELTVNQSGVASPLEASIINHVRTLGTIAEFRDRAAFNFERVSLLVNNMPLADSELCGRLRDYLSIAIETVDARLAAMLAHRENTETRGGIVELLCAIGATVHEFSEKYDRARYLGSETTREMLIDLESAFANLGMREEQEENIKAIVQRRAYELIDTFDFSAVTEKTLNDLSDRLSRTLAGNP